jgi:hypothetical protein
VRTWAGRTIAIGDQVVLRITIPCPRCANVTLPQAELSRDPGILRMIAQHNTQDLGDSEHFRARASAPML